MIHVTIYSCKRRRRKKLEYVKGEWNSPDFDTIWMLNLVFTNIIVIIIIIYNFNMCQYKAIDLFDKFTLVMWQWEFALIFRLQFGWIWNIQLVYLSFTYIYILKRRCAVVIAKSIFVGEMGFSLSQFLPIAFTHATIEPFFAICMTGSFECLVWMMFRKWTSGWR